MMVGPVSFVFYMFCFYLGNFLLFLVPPSAGLIFLAESLDPISRILFDLLPLVMHQTPDKHFLAFSCSAFELLLSAP